jgi:N-acylneuraminate cytidylyltransferase
MTEVLALILARGGSKGIPNKNVVPFLGRPLIEWTIESARAAKTVTRIVLTTDSEVIAECGRKAGAEAPFMRPAELARDDTRDHPVFVHTLNWLTDNESYRPDLIVHLRPTTPLRPAGLIDTGVRMMMEDQSADSLRSVCEPDNNPFKMWRIGDKYMAPLVALDMFEPFNQPRQILPKVYWQTGTVDITRPRTILEKNGMSGERILPLVIDRALAVDIDDPTSLKKAEEKCLAVGMGVPA